MLRLSCQSCVTASHACPVVRTSLAGRPKWGGRLMTDRAVKRPRTELVMNGSNPKNVVELALARPNNLYEHRMGEKFVCPGFVAQNHFFMVPLDYHNPQSSLIQVFVRELVAPSRVDHEQTGLLYLQGGPGFEGPRTTELSGWVKSALTTFRVFLMDQRGTGMSTPVTPHTLASMGDPEEQAKYLSHFRADSIIADAEAIRRSLASCSYNVGRWSILGQSFGGFCSLTYLSYAPSSLHEALLTGGIPPGVTLPCGAATAYRALFKRVLRQNDKYYSRFPGDEGLVLSIVKVLLEHPDGGPLTPAGNRLTPRMFLTLGLSGLGGFGGFERLHYLLERAFDGYTSGKELSYAFLAVWNTHMPWATNRASHVQGFDSWLPWASNPLYALLHESIYCQGEASKWAAWTVMQQEFAEQFDVKGRASNGRRIYFTGEMVFPFMFEDVAALRALKETAQLLADKADWEPLYDVEVLKQNKVPVAAASYIEDMYVDWNLAQETAAHVKGIRHWSTSEYMHSGIRDDGGHIFERLLGMARGNIPVF